MKKLSNLCLACVLLASSYAFAGGEKGLSGAYVTDPNSMVQPGSYFTISTAYNGHRYYLGVDTVAAKAPTNKDTVTWYEEPSYATMWVAGPLWSPTGQILEDKNYSRTVKSLWLAERANRERFLAVGEGKGAYNSLRLLADGALWFTEKDERERNKYINGFLYYYSPATETGVDVYRYLRYDPVYGFSRLYEAKPANSQRISVWDRKTGSDLIYNMTPSIIAYGYDVTHDTVKQPITSQVIYYESVDRFRSRYNQTDIFVHQSTPITDQETLTKPPYNLQGHFEWKSNPADEAHLDQYDGHSKMKYYTLIEDDTDPEHPVITWGWADTTMVWARKNGFKLKNNVWYDTIYAIGKSPIDRPTARFLRKPAGGGEPTEGDYINHNDVLYTHFTCHEQEYRDSVNVNRQIFHQDAYTTLTTSASPNNWVFDYSEEGADPAVRTHTFTVSGTYESGHVVRAVNGNVVDEYIGESGAVNIAGLPCYRDTIWTDAETPTIDHIDLYDTLLVRALNIDGTECDWVEAIYLPARNQISVRIKPYNSSATTNRTAQIVYSYSYWHSSAKGDNVTDSRVIWITQKWEGADNAELYAFHHSGEADAKGLQAVHEKHNVFYAIPQEPLNLPLHRDHWGYYRWFNYDGAGHDKDPEYNPESGPLWKYSVVPKNVRSAEFMLINYTTDASSRGRWDVIRDAEHPGTTYFGTDHFKKWTRTAVPAVSYPESNSKTGKIACDVSDYYNIETTGAIGELTSLTEPTLSYRQIFDIQPAKTRADEMATVRGNGSGTKWLENYTIVAPAGRAFSIQPQCPIAYRGSEEIDEEHLQYIYYFNPTGTDDANMGIKKADYDDNKAVCYGRIGKKKFTGDTLYHARLIPYSEIANYTKGTTKNNILMVNPRKETGYVLGKGERFAYKPIPKDTTDTTKLRRWIENELLNKPGQTIDAYKLTLVKGDGSNISIKKGDDYLCYSGNTFIIFGYGLKLGWSSTPKSQWGQHDDVTMTYAQHTGTINTYISGAKSQAVRLQMSADVGLIFITDDNTGYLTACNSSKDDDLTISNNNAENILDKANQGWIFYEIVSPAGIEEHFETPRWEKSTNGTDWTQVAHWDYSAGAEGKGEGISDSTGYTMTADGALHISNLKHQTAGTPIFYRLRTEHFQLAKFTGITRPADTEMLKLGGDIISEEEIERDYDIIYSLDMEHWPAPGTKDVVAHNKPFPWDFTELSYHYPLSVIPEALRVDSTEMPGKGEYAFINKFVVPEGPTTGNPDSVFECMAGAEHGYMLCVNAAGKRATIMNFDFNQLTCSGQQIYLVGNYCNPVNNSYEPEITADMEGSNDGGVTWTRIYRYKSGKIPFKSNTEPHWHQMALPIARDSIAKYKQFRCRAEISGAPYKNCYLLIDRLRFIEKNRAFSVFQNKATCIKEDSVVALVRINYQSAPELYQPGKLIAYQFQMWKDTANGGTGGYVPMLASKKNGDGTYTALDNNTEPKLQVFPGYLKDGFTAKESVEQPSLKSLTGNDYGYVLIPELNYDPSKSNTAGGRSELRAALLEQVITKLGLTGADATARHAFIDETNNIRTFDQIVAHDYNDFGTMSLGTITTAHIKSFVKVGDTWLLYIVCRLPVTQTDNNTFRVGVTVMNDLNDKPTFAEDKCATFRILRVKHTTSLLIDGEEWPNYSRAEIEADPSDDKELLPANETFRTSIKLTVKDKVGTYPTTNPRCQFDLLHAADSVRPNTAAGDLAFQRRYGCTRTQFVDDMEAFRVDDDRNVMRNIRDWSTVTPEMFTLTGRSLEVATEIYNRLNHLINDLHVLELGLDYRDIYMGDKADSWFYLLPIPATGLFDVNRSSSSLPDTTMSASVCNDTLWLELHSKQPTAKLRFGYDSRVGDTYIVPVVRASKSDANGLDGKHLNVRVAESWAETNYSVIIGWENTELISSNDPDWTEAKPFKYTQDKDMRGHVPSSTDYYQKGDVIHFTPATGNLYQLKAGYWYQFKAPFYAALSNDKYTSDPAEPTGHAQFVLAIAPDTVRWTPAHTDAANYWNDDHNWTPIMQHAPEDGFKATVPMKDTKVIIPEVEEGLSPIASDYVENQMDTLHYGYEKNTCNAILFRPNAEILGQEKLTYERAYVDIPLKTGNWQTFSPALDDIYSGDMYIPFSTSYNPSDPASGASTDTTDFAPKTFPYKDVYSGSYNPRVYPFAFYQGFYNSSVPVAFYNTDEEGTPVNTTTVQSKSSVDWVKTNALDMYYAPGKASVLTGYDATDEDGRSIVVRLPKPDDAYHGFGKNGGANYVAGPAVTLSRPNKMIRNLAYDKYAPSFSETEGLTYTLTNETESEIFFFGNPTMSLIDVYRLCVANADVLKHEAGSYSFTAYNLIDGDNYTVRTITGPGQFFVAPQRAVGLIANATQTAAKSLPIKLTPSALVAITGDGHLVSGDDSAKPMPRRAHNDEEAINPRRLYIAAANETDWGIQKAYLTLGVQENATSGYRYGEDALSIASGLNYYSDESYNTPLSMYTIADNQALMMDIRDTLNMIPLIFTTLDENYTFSNHTLLSFALNGQWTAPLFLHDAVTGDSIQIRNGMQIAIVTPLSDQLRYFINGGTSSTIPVVTPDDPGVVTGTENINGETNSPLNNNHSTIIYDMLGRRVKVLGKYELINNVQLPTGVYIIQHGQKTERMVIR